MLSRVSRWSAGWLAASVLLVAGFVVQLGEAASAAPAPAQSGELTVFAAASLTDAFNELGSSFESQQPASRVRFNYGASSQLRVQLEQGARGDVFASADTVQMDQARAAGLLAGEPQVFVRNVLVLILPQDNPRGIQALQDLARPGLRLVTTGPQVPTRARCSTA